MELWISALSAVGHNLYHMGERVIGDQADILEHDTMGAIKGILCTSKRPNCSEDLLHLDTSPHGSEGAEGKIPPNQLTIAENSEV